MFGVRRAAETRSPAVEQTLILISRSGLEEWRTSPHCLFYCGDERVWYYLDDTAWRQGDTRERMDGAHDELWSRYDACRGVLAEEARAALAAAAAALET